jgi:hypothetical protein
MPLRGNFSVKRRDGKMKKLLLFTLLFCFIAVSFLTVAMFALHTDCFCIKHLCDVCPKLFKIREILKQMTAYIAAAVVAAAGFFAVYRIIKADYYSNYPLNITDSNVRMNN